MRCILLELMMDIGRMINPNVGTVHGVLSNQCTILVTTNGDGKCTVHSFFNFFLHIVVVWYHSNFIAQCVTLRFRGFVPVDTCRNSTSVVHKVNASPCFVHNSAVADIRKLTRLLPEAVFLNFFLFSKSS